MGEIEFESQTVKGYQFRKTNRFTEPAVVSVTARRERVKMIMRDRDDEQAMGT